jgi:hypothetical protein
MSNLIASKVVCDDYVKAVNAKLGLPRKGVHIGGGRHVDIPDTPGIGWSIQWDIPRKHPKREDWTVTVHASVAAITTAIDDTWDVKPVIAQGIDR